MKIQCSRKNVCIALAILCLVAFFINKNRQETEILPTQIFLTDKKSIIIDAGHGGLDGGASSTSGIVEKHLNLAMAKKMEIQLMQLGYQVIMTRTEDISLHQGEKFSKRGDLAGRLLVSRENPQAIFVSIHMNTFSSPKYTGSQVYYSKNNPLSVQLAKSIQEQIQGDVQPQNTRVVKAADKNIYILYQADAPAVVVECGFLSNTVEAAMLAEDTYQEQLSIAIVQGIEQYYSGNGTVPKETEKTEGK